MVGVRGSSPLVGTIRSPCVAKGCTQGRFIDMASASQSRHKSGFCSHESEPVPITTPCQRLSSGQGSISRQRWEYHPVDTVVVAEQVAIVAMDHGGVRMPQPGRHVRVGLPGVEQAAGEGVPHAVDVNRSSACSNHGLDDTTPNATGIVSVDLDGPATLRSVQVGPHYETIGLPESEENLGQSSARVERSIQTLIADHLHQRRSNSSDLRRFDSAA
jgi:hypothetical protein